jgi:phosphoribosylformylglycinamidine (FGAM) synthase-like enzyme
MGQLVGCIKGIGEACRALDFPVVSGNVSLYNETNGRAILPTPTIGGVGVLDDLPPWRPSPSRRGRGHRPHRRDHRLARPVGLSARRSAADEEGAPPPVDLTAERRNGEFVRALIGARAASRPATTCSDGGLAVALAEMAMAGGIGAHLETPDRAGSRPTPPSSARTRPATS